MIFLLGLLLHPEVNASSECLGKTSDGKTLSIRLETMGPKGAVTRGEIVFENQGNRYGYQLAKDEITQYFEFDEAGDNSAVVGLVAYAGGEGPVTIKYVGTNFVDMDLKTILESGVANNIRGNSMRVWRGPGYEPTNQVNISRIVCATWPEI
jgi:hypothetical protein